MKYKTYLIAVCATILPFLMLVLNVYELFKIDDSYPFNSEFFSSFSIYSSKGTYIGYLILFSFALIGVIVSAFKFKWKTYLILLIVSLGLFAYPFINQ